MDWKLQYDLGPRQEGKGFQRIRAYNNGFPELL